MSNNRYIKEWTSKAPKWNDIVSFYRARPGRVQWLSNRHPVMRGEIEDTPEPVEAIDEEAAA